MKLSNRKARSLYTSAKYYTEEETMKTIKKRDIEYKKTKRPIKVKNGKQNGTLKRND